MSQVRTDHKMSSRKRGLTLIELVIAILLVAGMIGSILAIDTANQKMYVVVAAEREALAEVSAVLTHIQQKIREGTSVTIDDSDPNPITIVKGAQTAFYTLNGNQLEFHDWSGATEIVANRLKTTSGFVISHPTPVSGRVISFTVTLIFQGSWGGVITKEITQRGIIGARSFQQLTIQVI